MKLVRIWTLAEAEALGCAYFHNRHGVTVLCHTSNPHLWPRSRVHNEETTACPGCVDMLARRVEAALTACPHGFEWQEACDACSRRGIWADP